LKKPYFLVLIALLCIRISASSQDYFPDSLVKYNKTSLDTLPLISYKKNIPLLVLGLANGAFYFGFNADEYRIGNIRTLNNKRLEPYFYAQNDPIVIENYKYHRKTRPIYLTIVPVGYLVFISGFATIIGSSLSGVRPNNRNLGTTLMLSGLASFGVAAGIRINSFSKMKKARVRYNELVINHRFKPN
jgi:hypothetical protein